MGLLSAPVAVPPAVVFVVVGGVGIVVSCRPKVVAHDRLLVPMAKVTIVPNSYNLLRMVGLLVGLCQWLHLPLLLNRNRWSKRSSDSIRSTPCMLGVVPLRFNENVNFHDPFSRS